MFCLAGTAAIMGWIPSSIGGNPAATRELSANDRALLASQLQPAPPPPAPADVRTDLAPPQQLADGRNTLPPQQLAMNEAAPAQHHTAAKPAHNWCSTCGNVESIREITTRAQGSGLGAAGGAVLGGLLGHQVGGGNGQKLATVAGAVGGAVVGNQVEGNMKATKSYEIRVRLDDGTARTFHQQSAPRWHDGDRVKIVNGALHSAT
jgi:outer membrane lipoprotein SlyB